MKESLCDRLWRRECGDQSSYAGLHGIYGLKEWINDLDIVNELGGHTGCVNALSWSRSGRLLASGSDDKHLNIYTYQPESSTAPFALNTTVLTGHKANIFSVKFMPHSNDRTLVTCAGDSQVRVFDIEYSSSNSANTAATSAFAASARSARFNNFFDGARYLSDGNTNARVYRSHADRVKRIVTESSPHLFLTCSEDGEVRQWDLRQPSSAYPSPRGGQGFMAYRPGLDHDDSNVPPPLISYKRFNLDLNTISCSPSQPHYIALGGAHMHCFLHDRRMLGRDISAEKGTPGRWTSNTGSAADEESMGRATRCVRRFAPRGKHGKRNFDDGHITACKISDANPNEMVVSWSGDHIYSFDLIRSPDARDQPIKVKSSVKGGGKRKRPKPTSLSSQESADRHRSRRRSAEPDTLRIQYENGDTSNIPFPPQSDLPGDLETPEGLLEHARNSVLTEAQQLSMQIAKGLVKLRQMLFSLQAAAREAAQSEQTGSSSLVDSFASALALATTYLPQMDDIDRKWAYPLEPTRETVALQQSLRRNRQTSWRFVQAAGTIARALGNPTEDQIQREIEDPAPFLKISPAPNEDDSIDQASHFGYDFLKAILLWIRGGRPELLAGFKRGTCPRRLFGRFPIDVDATEEAIDCVLLPYLLELAGDTPIINVDASRFEHDETRFVFPSQRAAVTAFGNAVKIPLEDLGTAAARFDGPSVSNLSAQVRSLDRASTSRFWVLRVCRGLLMETGNSVNYAFVNRAFGGLIVENSESDDESDGEIERSQDDSEANEEAIRAVSLARSDTTDGDGVSSVAEFSNSSRSDSPEMTPITHDLDFSASDAEFPGGREGEESEMESNGGWHMDLVDSSDEGEDDETEDPTSLRFVSRKTRRGEVALDTPCSPHTRSYRGHCNIQTVKDVNFFGLDDEYVVSGSDSGHIFIWDRKTANLVNILEGDSEVVNVVQGHPYEPILAASGIDNTIKIFSPDQQAQDQARSGVNILDPENPANVHGGSLRNIGGLESRKRISDSYRIISQNHVDRRGGMSEAYVTRNMLSRLAATLRGRQTTGTGIGPGPGLGDGAALPLDDENCLVM